MDTSKSLQELEGYDAGDPKTKTTPMVRRCLTLHRTPLVQFSAEDCRLMLGQQISPHFLVPLALQFLEQNPLESGIGGYGALLETLLKLPGAFWAIHSDERTEVWNILVEVKLWHEAIDEMMPQIERFERGQT